MPAQNSFCRSGGMIRRGNRGGASGLEDIAGIIRFDGTVLCLSCADDNDLSGVISEEDLIMRQNIRDDDCYVCDRCGREIKG